MAACGGAEPSDSMVAPPNEPAMPAPLDPKCYEPYAKELISYTAGENAGYGQAKLPDVVLGPTTNGSLIAGALDVLTLGVGGEIVVGFGDKTVIDGPGVDFIVWENPFYLNGDPTASFAEYGEVSVSLDGSDWHTFPCDVDTMDGSATGCAGWFPRKEFDPCTVVPLDAQLVGGDQFDLADLGLDAIRYVKIRDLAESGAAPTAGFDLDAVGAIHLSP